MAKTFTAKNIASINQIRFEVNAQGNLTKIEVNCEVNYGKMGLPETVDLLPQLTNTQKEVAKSFYNSLKTKLDAIILG